MAPCSAIKQCLLDVDMLSIYMPNIAAQMLKYVSLSPYNTCKWLLLIFIKYTIKSGLVGKIDFWTQSLFLRTLVSSSTPAFVADLLRNPA